MTKQNFDVVVIGGGPGGYVAAIRAAQLGFKVACIESRGALGGTCLNVGCIPSKALLQSSEFYAQAQHHSEEHGVVLSSVKLDLKKMLDRKNKIVKGLTVGVEGLFKKNNITYIKGKGNFVSPTEIAITGGNEKTKVIANNVIIATGSVPVELKSVAPFDGEQVVSSTEALCFDKVPKKLIIIGGGYIGLEMGSVWSRLGSKVTVIEAQENILATMDQDVIREMTRTMKKQGLEILTKTSLKEIKKTKSKVIAVCETSDGTIEVEGDKVLVAVGRRANVDGLGLEKCGVKVKDSGKIAIDSHFKTSQSNIYAIGDVVDGPMLAHKAEDEGVAVAEIIAGQSGHVNYEAIPGVVYTWPEAATVGKTEQQCKEDGVDYAVGKFPFAANGRAKCLGEATGFVKMIADKKTDKLLGVHMVGPNVSELIAEAVIAFEFHSSAEDLARSVHAHPTLSEVIKEAAMGVAKRTIHM